jgi:hypothetical protein
MAALASSFVIAALPLAAAISDGNYRVMTCRRCPDAADGLRGPARLTARRGAPAPAHRIPFRKGLGADSEEKRVPASDIGSVVVDSLKARFPAIVHRP